MAAIIRAVEIFTLIVKLHGPRRRRGRVTVFAYIVKICVGGGFFARRKNGK